MGERRGISLRIKKRGGYHSGRGGTHRQQHFVMGGKQTWGEETEGKKGERLCRASGAKKQSH